MALWVDKVDLSIDIISVMSDKDLSIDQSPWMPFITIKVYQSVSNRWSASTILYLLGVEANAPLGMLGRFSSYFVLWSVWGREEN